MPKKHKDTFCWPVPLQHIPTMDLMSSDMVTIAELSSRVGPGSTRDLYLAMMDVNAAQGLIKSEELPFSYCPGTGVRIADSRFTIEPLATKWQSAANHFVQIPSTQFLNAFTLVPRPVDSRVFWDDMSKPLRDIVRAEMVSVYTFPNMSPAIISVRRDYLLEYADRTNRAVIAFWYEHNFGPNVNDQGQPYSQEDFGDFHLPGCMIGLRSGHKSNNTVSAEFWGVRLVYTPSTTGNAVDDTYDDTPPLSWPGIAGQVTRRTSDGLGMQLVYVKDSVLDIYEEHPETYLVHPEDGAVSYRNHWSVSHCHRIGRDLIAVEIRKLYEGTGSNVIQHWHKHAISPPTNIKHREPNIGTRAKTIVLELIALGETLSELIHETTGKSVQPSDLIGLDCEHLRRSYWYDDDSVRPITRRIPHEMGKDTFLDRCESLVKLIVEGIGVGESHLRAVLITWGMDSQEIKGHRCLKLLDHIVQLKSIAGKTGLEIPQHFSSVLDRYHEEVAALKTGKFLPSLLRPLFVLYDLRSKLAAHRGGKDSQLFTKLGITQEHVAAGWGEQLDTLYDSIGDSLHAAVESLKL